MTGHNEVVLVVYDPAKISYEDLLKVFWEKPQPNPEECARATIAVHQYRSGIYTFTDEQKQLAEASKAAYAQELSKAGYDDITTEIIESPEFYYAEDLSSTIFCQKCLMDYCGLGGVGVCYPATAASK